MILPTFRKEFFIVAKRHKKHGGHEEEMNESWLLPYSDLMTLLLAVFIVLFAVSKIDQSKASEMASQFSSMLTIGGGGTGVMTGGSGPSDIESGFPDLPKEDEESQEELKMSAAERSDLQELQRKLNAYFEEAGLEGEITSVIDERGLVVSLSSHVLFDSGVATIKSQESINFMLKTGEALSKIQNNIRVEGHTDNVPISVTYPSNLHLSSARALTVATLFLEKCNVSPEKLVAVGYGEYHPVATNDTEEGKAKNRRVDIVVLSSRYTILENKIENAEGRVQEDETTATETATETAPTTEYYNPLETGIIDPGIIETTASTTETSTTQTTQEAT